MFSIQPRRKLAKDHPAVIEAEARALKRESFLNAVNEFVELAVTKHPQIEKRMRKAAEILLSEKYRIDGAKLARVWNGEAPIPKTYHLRVATPEKHLSGPAVAEKPRWVCTCEDYRRGNSPLVGHQPCCKHILTIQLAQRIATRSELAEFVKYREELSPEMAAAMDDAARRSRAVEAAAFRREAERRELVAIATEQGGIKNVR